MMNKIYILITLSLLTGCQEGFVNNEHYNDINLYQGLWKRTGNFNSGEPLVERLIINNLSISYCLYDSITDFIIDKHEGMVILGSNNKMEWNTVSELDNLQSRYYWKIMDVQKDSLWLFSNLLGDRVYKKYESLNSSIDSIDCIARLLSYRDLLPIKYDKIKQNTYALEKTDGIQLLLNNPICSNVTFLKDDVGDWIRSFSFSTANLGSSFRKLLTDMTFVHEHDGIKDYSNAQSVKYASYIISTSEEKGIASVSIINGYNYWINVSQYLNGTIDIVKQNFSDLAYQFSSKGYQKVLPIYKFTANGKYGYKYLTFATDESGAVIDIKAEFTKNFLNVDDCLFMLNMKYSYDRTENGEYVYKDKKNRKYELAYNASTRIMHYYLIDF